MEVEPKFANIGDYWDDATIDKVVELIREYEDLFPTKFLDLKDIMGDLHVMKITLKLMQSRLKRGHVALIINTKKMSAQSWKRFLRWALSNQWRNMIW